MNLVKQFALVSAVALAPAFALAQTTPPAGGSGATAPAATTPAPAKGERKGRHGQRGERGERFKKADTNGDGALSKAEADAAGMKRLSANFDKLDANKDGKVTREEMQAARKAHRGERKNRRGQGATPATSAAPATK